MKLPAPNTHARRILVHMRHVGVPLVPDSIERATGLDEAQVNSALTALKRRGLVNSRGGKPGTGPHAWTVSSCCSRLLNSADRAASDAVRRWMASEVVDG